MPNYYDPNQQQYYGGWPDPNQGYQTNWPQQQGNYYPAQQQYYQPQQQQYWPQPQQYYPQPQSYNPNNNSDSLGGYGLPSSYTPSSTPPPAAAATTSTAVPSDSRMTHLQNRVGALQTQFQNAAPADQGAIRQQIHDVRGRMQNARQNQAPPESAAAAPQAQPGYSAGGANNPAAWSDAQYAKFGDTPNVNSSHMSASGQLITASPGDFHTQFGDLTPSSGGNTNLYKRNGAGEYQLFNYDPTKGWQQMSGDQYRQNYGNATTQPFADPSQYGQAAGQIYRSQGGGYGNYLDPSGTMAYNPTSYSGRWSAQ